MSRAPEPAMASGVSEARAYLVELREGTADAVREAHRVAGTQPAAARAALVRAGLDGSVHLLAPGTHRYVYLAVGGTPSQGPDDSCPELIAPLTDAVAAAARGPATALEPLFELLSHQAPRLATLSGAWIPLEPGGVDEARAWGRRASDEARASQAAMLANLRGRDSWAMAVFLSATGHDPPAVVTVSHSEDARRAGVGFFASTNTVDVGLKAVLAHHASVEMSTLELLGAFSTT